MQKVAQGGHKMSAQRNETEAKQFQKCFEIVSFQFHFVVRRGRCEDSLRSLESGSVG